MAYSRSRAAAFLLATTALVPLSDAAHAESQDQAATNAKIQALEQQIQDLSAQVQDLKRSTSDQYADAQNQQAQAPKPKIDNGRLSISSADGKFTAAVRGLAQLDWGAYGQNRSAAAYPAAYGPNLSSGTNFRRVYLGVQGKVFGDWSYNLNFDFGGSGGTETPGHVQSVYLEYDGLAPFAVRAGAFPPPSNLEDATSAGDTIFLERNAPSDLQRNIAGGDGRDAVSLLYLGDQLFGAFSYTGAKVQDAAVFGEQQAVVGRASYLFKLAEDAKLVVGGNGLYVFQLPNSVARGSAIGAVTPGAAALNTITLSDPPELTIDSQGLKLANTAAIPANHTWQWGVETAAAWQNLYAQAGYYDFEVERAPTAFKVFTSPAASHTEIGQPLNDSFSGWYLQGTWILTGESRTYNTATGAFTAPKPAEPFNIDGSGWGAFELAGRFSDLDLNDHVSDASNVVTAFTAPATKTYSFFNTVRGGDQKIWTAALNWYPNSVVKLALQYQFIDISRLQSGATPSTVIVSAPTTGAAVLPASSASQDIQTIAARVQLSL
jgi:phosphate-selective porin OprO/OprP